MPLRSLSSSFLIAVFLLASLTGCGLIVRGTQKGVTEVANSELFWQGRHGKLSDQEMQWVKAAWQYFVKNYHAETGLVNGVEGFSTASVWNVADIISATIAAHEFELIDDYEFDHRMTPLLEFLNQMSLSYGMMPDVFYSAEGGGIVDQSGNDYDEKEEGDGGEGSGGNKKGSTAADGSDLNADQEGWSAIDIGRLMIWLQILRGYAPQYAEYIDKAVLRWDFCKVINECGELSGVNRNSSASPMSRNPKEPLGYYDYAVMGYAAWGFPKGSSGKNRSSVKIYDIELPVSKDDFRETGIADPLGSLPYLLLGLEFNWDESGDRLSPDSYSSNPALADMAQRIYKVQEKRYQYERIFTARTDYRRSSPPYLIYDSIFANGYAWNTLTPEGELHADLALVSTSAVFGMWALWDTPYTDGLMQLVSTLYDPKRGWFEGRREKDGGYERTITCTTNAMILEALYYKVYGKLYRILKPKSYADIMMQDEFRRPDCSPPEFDDCASEGRE